MDTFSYSYRGSPFSIVRKSMTNLAHSRSTGSLNSLHTPSYFDMYNGSGFSPLRSPSRPVSIDSVRCLLKDVYLEQLSKQSKLWSSLSRNEFSLHRTTIGWPNDDHFPPTPLPSSEKLLIVEADEGRVVKDFAKEILSTNSTTKRRIRLTGDFGSGRTTVLQNLVLNWCSDDSELSYQFPILLYIRSEYAYSRRSLEDVLQTLLPPAELRLVMRVLNDWDTRTQVLFLVDDYEKYSQSPTATWSKSSYDYESGEEKLFPYPLDMNRLLKGLLLPETMVVFAGQRGPEQEVSKRKWINYVVYGLNDGHDHEFRIRNPLAETLSSILGDKKTDRHDVLFPGIEHAVTKLLARMSRPSHMSYEDCIRILGWLSLIYCQDYMPPLTLESVRNIERKKELFQRDERLREDADEVLRAAIDCDLLSAPGTGVIVTTPANTDLYSPPRKRFDYVLAFPHQAFALYLAARTFVSLNLNIDWARIRQRHHSGNGNGQREGLDTGLVSNERYLFYFLTGIDASYADDLLSRGIRRENGSDKALYLPWTVSQAARKSPRFITAYADEHFSVTGVGEASDSVILNKLTIYYRSGDEKALDFESMLFTDAYHYEGSPITSLRFRHCVLYDPFFRYSSGRLFDNLTNLELSDCHFYQDDALEAFLLRLTAASSTLTSLRMNKCQQLAESIELMRLISCRLFRLHTLQISDVKDNERSQTAAIALAEGLERTNSVKRLLLLRNEVANALFDQIINRLALEELDLSYCRFRNDPWPWIKFIDELKSNLDSPLRKSLVTLRLDGVDSFGDALGLQAAFESCKRLKLISMRDCFRNWAQGERFREQMRRGLNANGVHKDVFI